MKKIITTLLSIVAIGSFAMTDHAHLPFYNKTAWTEDVKTNDTSTIKVADSEIIIIDNDTAVNVRINERNNKDSDDEISSSKEYEDVNVEVIEGENSTQIIVHKDGDTIKNYEMNFDFSAGNKRPDNFTSSHDNENNNKNFTFSKKKNNKRFKGHWAGFEMGLNNYLTDDMSMTPDNAWMEINTGKSWNFNLNFAQFSIPILRDRVGLVSGLGFEWSNYHFSNENSITKDPTTHTITPVDLSAIPLKKNRLQTTYLTAPLLMEAQFGDSKRISVSGGVLAGLKLGSHTKYKTSNDKQKNKDDFYLQSFRYGFTARVNYDNVGLYVNYYNVPLFLEGKGPELYPFAAGIVFSFD